jgi:thiosulfate dehydrogenase (quinone) large subunit
MKNHEWRDRTIAYALLRVFLGANLALHGVSRLLGPSKFEASIEAQFAHSLLPHPTVVALALLLPWAESLIGSLILVGLWTGVALAAGALLMIVLTIGSCLIQDWPAAAMQLLYQMAYFILLFLHGFNHWSADSLVHRRFRSGTA